MRRALIGPPVRGVAEQLVDLLEGVDEWSDAKRGDVRGVWPGEVIPSRKKKEAPLEADPTSAPADSKA